MSEPIAQTLLFILEDSRGIELGGRRRMPFRKLLRVVSDGVHDVEECCLTSSVPLPLGECDRYFDGVLSGTALSVPQSETPPAVLWKGIAWQRTLPPE